LGAGAENEFCPRLSRLWEQGEEILSGSSRAHIGVHSLAVENTHLELKFWGRGENAGTAIGLATTKSTIPV
jgi:hypothetical protein